MADAEGFVRALAAAGPAPAGNAKRRIAAARANSWETRIAWISGLIEAERRRRHATPDS